MSYSSKLVSIKKIIINFIILSLRRFLNVARFMCAFLLSSLDHIFGTIPTLIRANRIVSKKIKDKLSEDFSSGDPRLKLPIEYLKEYYNSEIDRLSRIEEKAKATVVGVTIAVTLITAPTILLPTTLDDFANQADFIKWLLLISLIIAVTFLLLSGYFAFLAFSVGEISKPLLEDHISLKKKKQVRETYIRYIELNSLRIIQRANLLSASMDCLRNGLVLFLILLIISLISIF